MQVEQNLCELLLPRKKVSNCNILHYWPFYCPKYAKSVVKEGKIKTVAEFYEAEPSFVNKLYESEYEKFGLKTKKVNTLINQNESFEFEKNFIVASNYTKETYSRLFPEANIHVCSYGPIGQQLRADLDRKIERTINTNRKKIVFVGQVCLEKGTHLLIEAGNATGIPVDLIGPIRNGQQKVFEDLISKSRYVTHLGPKRNSEVIRLLDNYDAFALPSLSDNYSLAVNEALSRGLPVLVTENCGNKDDIKKFNLGYSATTADLNSLAEKMEKLVSGFDYSAFHYGLINFFAEDNRIKYSKAVLDVYKSL